MAANLWHVLLFTVCILQVSFILRSIDCKKYDGSSLVEQIVDAKDLKKMLRTKNNVLVMFMKTAKEGSALLKIISQVADEVKGQATLATVDCSGEGRKLCKKLKVSPEPTALKHYKNGEFHKDYERKTTLQSMVNFLMDPTGDMPWEEDENSKNIVHVPDATSLAKLLHRERGPVMVMFYAPWCGFCKRLKPEYESAAAELKGHSVLAAMDVNKPDNAAIRKHFNITGFPTLLYFEQTVMKMKYDGENNKQGLVNFMKNPIKQPEKPKDEEWSDVPSDVVHLTDETFDSSVQTVSSVLVMFYAPWCGHCKKMKPEYVSAASILKEEGIAGILAAVDATKEKNIADRFKVTGYPTIKYFKDGEMAFDVNFRTADKIIDFMKDPKEPPPPPKPEIPWSEVPSNVMHLNEEDFKPFLKRKKHVLVMFYAPWCGHCKKAKPEFESAADYFVDDPKVEFAALDCTMHTSICNTHSVRGYPTIKYFSYYKIEKPYEGGRTENDFVEFMKSVIEGVFPTTPLPHALPEQWWVGHPGTENVKILKEDTFESTVASYDNVLVMFYAPWCEHCKNLKPIFVEAATQVQANEQNCLLAAVDATVEKNIAAEYDVKTFPTLKLFRQGKYVSDYNRPRTLEDITHFMQNLQSAKEEL